MLLAVNIGNTNIRFGIFQEEDVFTSWVINTKPYKTTDEHFALFKNMYVQQGIEINDINKIVVGSVVPPITEEVVSALEQIHNIKPKLVDRYTKSPVQHSSNQIGTDLYANAVASHYMYKGNKIIVDFGTALTLTCIDSLGKLKGVIIAPGINTSLNSLIEKTSQLPEIQLKKPKSVLGLDTVTCMESGMVYGFLSMIEGLIERIKEEINDSNPMVISTGGLGHIYSPLTEKIQINDRLHTLKGLMYLNKEFTEI